MIPATDPFMAGHEPPTRRPGDFTRSKRGTPYVSDPTGKLVKPKRKSDPPRIATTPYSRPSGLGKIIEDMYSIHKWDQRQEAYGFAVAPELVERAAILIEIEDRESQQWKDEADKIVGAAKAAAKASLAADRGTHAHELTEDDDEGRDIIARIEAGEEIGLTAEVQQSLVAAWRAMLVDDGLEILAVESPVVNDTYRAAGTLDRVGRLIAPLRFRLITGEIVELPAGWTGILDVKSGKRRLNPNGTVMYWHGYAVQVFLYANGVPYDTETDTRCEWPYPINQQWALIAHLDVLGAIDGKPSCDLILVDLEAGRRAADLCVAAKAWGNEATVFSVAQIVEGVEAGVGTREAGIVAPPGCDSPPAAVTTPSTLSPDDCNPHGIPRSSAGAPVQTAPPTAGEGEDVPSAPSPAVSHDQRRRGYDTDGVAPGGHRNQAALQHQAPTPPMSVAGEGATTLPSPAKSWPLADPDRLALVDARNQLATEPDQGADLTDVEFAPLWDQMRAQFDALDPAARSWRGELVSEAQRRNVPFHVQQVRTERTYHLNKALIALCAAEGDNDELLRALLALVVGQVALFPAIHPGHVVGSLTAAEAERFSALVDRFNGPGLAAYIDESGLFRLRGAA